MKKSKILMGTTAIAIIVAIVLGYNFLNQKTSANEEDFEMILKLNELGIDVLGDVCEFAEFSGDKEMDEFRRLFMEWYNNYPQYVLCGYAPVEFGKK